MLDRLLFPTIFYRQDLSGIPTGKLPTVPCIQCWKAANTNSRQHYLTSFDLTFDRSNAVRHTTNVQALTWTRVVLLDPKVRPFWGRRNIPTRARVAYSLCLAGVPYRRGRVATRDGYADETIKGLHSILKY